MEQPEITAVKHDYSRTLSDGAYGSERAAVTYWANVRPGEDVDEVLDDLAGRAREYVEGRLKASRSEAVRQALETPEERRDRLEAEERAWREEREERAARRGRPGAEREAPGDETDEGSPF